jgi:hypothetical protein
MREICTSGSVGGPVGQPAGSTRLVARLGSAQRHGATLGEALGVSIPGRKPPWSRGTSERESVRQIPRIGWH